jgi:glyoxylase-like metal-dependent hydrolase (beta-lactamase superfamily II)
VTSAELPDFRLYAIRYAERAGRRGEHFYGHAPRPDEAMPMAYYVWLAASDDTAVVVDAGFTEATAERRGRTWLASPTDTLAALGIDAASVPWLVLTHLHYDHTGNAGAFPAARFVIQEREMAFWTGRYASRGDNPTLVEADDIAFLAAGNFGGRVHWVDGDAEVVPGITVHRVGGHTAGMQIVRVHTEQGFAVLASDASHFYANLEEDRPYAIVHTLPEMHRAFDTIRRLADRPSLVVAGHDPQVMSRYPPVSPELAGRAVRVA